MEISTGQIVGFLKKQEAGAKDSGPCRQLLSTDAPVRSERSDYLPRSMPLRSRIAFSLQFLDALGLHPHPYRDQHKKDRERFL